ncbi:MAG: hypothetical protein LC795_13400 [Acidobacteria bacterium]|nr:hypothetical protein [Acidobacteriota bacterium]
MEKRFREAERRLDELLRRDKAAIAARGVAITDSSVRAYTYKSEYLCWSHRFETRRARGSEVEKVMVWVSFHEGDEGAVRVWRCAEIFQVSSLSRWRSTTERLLPLEDVMRRGLACIVLEWVSAGEAAAAAVV